MIVVGHFGENTTPVLHDRNLFSDDHTLLRTLLLYQETSTAFDWQNSQRGLPFIDRC